MRLREYGARDCVSMARVTAYVYTYPRVIACVARVTAYVRAWLRECECARVCWLARSNFK